MPPAGTVGGASVFVDVTAAGEASVALTYRIHITPGTTSVPIRGVTFDGARPAAVRVSAESRALAAEWVRTRPPLVAGRVPLTPGAEPGELSLAYELPGDGRSGSGMIDLRVPLLLVDWPPDEAREGMFSARISLPAGYTVVERFPTVPLVETSVPGGRTAVELSLPAIPSMLRLRARRGAARLTFAARVDVAVVLGLFALATLAWMAFRRSATAT